MISTLWWGIVFHDLQCKQGRAKQKTRGRLPPSMKIVPVWWTQTCAPPLFYPTAQRRRWRPRVYYTRLQQRPAAKAASVQTEERLPQSFNGRPQRKRPRSRHVVHGQCTQRLPPPPPIPPPRGCPSWRNTAAGEKMEFNLRQDRCIWKKKKFELGSFFQDFQDYTRRTQMSSQLYRVSYRIPRQVVW